MPACPATEPECAKRPAMSRGVFEEHDEAAGRKRRDFVDRWRNPFVEEHDEAARWERRDFAHQAFQTGETPRPAQNVSEPFEPPVTPVAWASDPVVSECLAIVDPAALTLYKTPASEMARPA